MNAEVTNAFLVSIAGGVGTLVVGLAGVGLAILQKKAGLQANQVALQLDANMREKLQATFVTAIGKYVRGDKDGAVTYVLTQAADAVAHFDYGPTQIANILVDKAAAWGGVPVAEALTKQSSNGSDGSAAAVGLPGGVHVVGDEARALLKGFGVPS